MRGGGDAAREEIDAVVERREIRVEGAQREQPADPDLERGVRVQVVQALSGLRVADGSIDAAGKAVAAATDAFEARVLRQRAGTVTANDVLDAESALRKAQADRIDAHVGYRLAEAGLQFAVGVLPAAGGAQTAPALDPSRSDSRQQ